MAKREKIAVLLSFPRFKFMSIAEIQKMSHSERLMTMEALWDALCHEDREPMSPDWHQGILKDRSSKIASGQATFLSLAKAKERIEG
jgi:hypothetical protein